MAQTSPNLYGKLFMVKKGRPSLCSGLDNLKAIHGIIYVAVLVLLAFTMTKNMPGKYACKIFTHQNSFWWVFSEYIVVLLQANGSF